MQTFNNPESVVIEKANKETMAENFARGSIKMMGVCIASSSNEHPIIRLSGITLAAFPKNKNALIPLTISLGGFLLAKDKKKAFIKRAYCFVSTVFIAGLIAH